jgi:hypothetical protein
MKIESKGFDSLRSVPERRYPFRNNFQWVEGVVNVSEEELWLPNIHVADKKNLKTGSTERIQEEEVTITHCCCVS